jgi:tripartite-type tricarboxylate transporter receptor subunit TctC
LAGFELEFWIGMLAPSRTPAAVVTRLNSDIGDILRTPAMQAAMLAQGARAAPGTPEQFAAHIARESAPMSKLIEATGMRAE